MVITDRTFDTAMLSLQGPGAKRILQTLTEAGRLPEPIRNALDTIVIHGTTIQVARTGYTGEPLLLRTVSRRADGWTDLGPAGGPRGQAGGAGGQRHPSPGSRTPPVRSRTGNRPGRTTHSGLCNGVVPVRRQPEPPQGRFHRPPSPGKTVFRPPGDPGPKLWFHGRSATPDHGPEHSGKGVARAGCKVFARGRQAGVVTSGTMVPFWRFHGRGSPLECRRKRGCGPSPWPWWTAICWKKTQWRWRCGAGGLPPASFPFICAARPRPLPGPSPVSIRPVHPAAPPSPVGKKGRRSAGPGRGQHALASAPMHQPHPLGADPIGCSPPALGRRPGRPICRTQAGTGVLRCRGLLLPGNRFHRPSRRTARPGVSTVPGLCQVETRPVSGQMANTAVFSAMVDFLNRADRKSEQRRMAKVMNHHIIRGGHLSAQPMGALRDFVARDPKSEKTGRGQFPRSWPTTPTRSTWQPAGNSWPNTSRNW